MAEKNRKKIGNKKPTEYYRERTLSYTSPDDINCAGEAVPNAEVTLSNIIRYNHFEVGNNGSSFSGTDSYDNEIKNITFADREPLMVRYDYITDVDDYTDDDDDSFLDSILSSNYYYEQDIEGRNKLKQQVPRWENQARPFITYDEEYFQHIFNWPKNHTLKTRKVGGFLEETKVCACTGETQEGNSSTEYTTTAVSVNFNGSFTLDKTRSELYWVDADSNGNWVYRELKLDPLSGEITGDEGVPGNVSATIKIEFDWDDNPNTAGVAVGTIGWSGSGVSFKQSGEKGSKSETVTLNGGDYLLNLTNNQGGFDVTNSGTRIKLYDGDGKDTNSEVKLSIVSTTGSGVTAKFDSKGNLTIDGTSTVSNESNPANLLTDKMGQPIIYHGGTDDNCIFFNYVPENITTNSTNKNSTIQHIFNDPDNVTNSLTSSNSDVTVVERSPADAGGGDDSNERKHYVVTINGIKIGSIDDIQITVNGTKSASGLRTSTFEVSRIKLLEENKFKVWFKAGNGDNSYVRDWSVSYGQAASQSSGSTTTLIPIGDTVNGATITNIVNYVVDVALKRIASASSKKNEENANVSENRFVNVLGNTVDEYKRTKGWLHLNDVSDLRKGMLVYGDGIKHATKITGIDQGKRIIYVDKSLAKSVKSIRFTDSGSNRVSKHTLCYATISGGSDFTEDQEYTTNSGIKIVVRAGKGIINRSAIVGVYRSKNRKSIKYSPLFYSSDVACTPETDEDDNGKFVLGTVRWDNDTRDTGLWLMKSPKTEIAYKISSIYLSFTLSPIDRDTFERFLTSYNNGTNIIQLYGEIGSYVKSTLGGKKAAAVYDDVCRDDIRLDYFQAYSPDEESYEYQTSSDGIEESIKDACLPRTIQEIEDQRISQQSSNTLESVKEQFEKYIRESTSQSSILSEEYYAKLVGDEDSLMNKIKKGSKDMIDSTPTEKVNEFPATIEGTDDSGVENYADSYRDLPPAMDRVKYFVEDLLIADDRYMSPTLDLDPATTINQPRLIIRSKPCWEWDDSQTTYSYPVSSGSITSTIDITVNTDSDGYVDTITSVPGAVTAPTSTFIGGTAATGTEGEPGYVPGTFGSGCSYSGAWRIGPKDARDNLYVGERAESMGQGAYYEAINVSLNPELRDLDYRNRDSDDDVLAPTPKTYPDVLWEPNVSYQMDFYKLFWFRLNELTDLVGETLENFGNPYLDTPVRAKIKKDITPSTTSIKVDSTIGFLSSGYLSIPKYTKKIVTDETGNNKPYFSYSGEEIIYYGSKTATAFNDIVRESLSSTSDQLITIPAREVEPKVRYKIVTLGDTKWQKFGGNKNASVGDVFVATGLGNGTGEVEVFCTNEDDTPEPNRRFGSTITPKLTSISSYELGFGVSQFWVNRLREI